MSECAVSFACLGKAGVGASARSNLLKRVNRGVLFFCELGNDNGESLQQTGAGLDSLEVTFAATPLPRSRSAMLPTLPLRSSLHATRDRPSRCAQHALSAGPL